MKKILGKLSQARMPAKKERVMPMKNLKLFILAAAMIVLAAVTPGMKAQAANVSLPDKTPLWFDAEYYATRYPDVAAVFCVGDPAASGALSAIRANASDCKIIGFDGNPEAKEAILDEETGKWWVSEISQDPHQIGTRNVEEMYSFMTDGTVTDKVVYIAPYIITAETLAAEGTEDAAAEEAPAEDAAE